MTNQDTALGALVGCIIFFLLAFGLRSWIHYRRTGSSGFVGLSGRPGSVEWFGGVLFAVAMVAGFAAPIGQLTGSVEPLAAFDAAWVRAAGACFYVVGVLGTLWAQFSMGNSWRIGVDVNQQTALVAVGPFRWIRNPIFTAMSVAMVGLSLLVPNVISAIAIIALAAALEIHVRLVEEPFLTRAHGERYRRYAASVGRFLPGIGRLEELR